jgi:hypothetical protein
MGPILPGGLYKLLNRETGCKRLKGQDKIRALGVEIGVLRTAKTLARRVKVSSQAQKLPALEFCECMLAWS